MADDGTDQTPDLTRGVPLADVPDAAAGGVLAGTAGEDDVMLARWTDDDGTERVSALAASCTHAGAALPHGLRTGDLVRCPFHHACFDLRTGEARLAPAYAPLARYDTEVVDGVVRVTGRSDGAAPGPDAVRAAADGGDGAGTGPRRVVVLGGGAAGFAAVERLRREGHDGEVVLVSAEPDVPVDRTKLSKAYLAGQAPADALPLLPRAWYAEHGVQLRLGTTATAVDTAARRVALEGGEQLAYDALLLAPGSEPVRPDVEGTGGADDALVLRTTADADAVLSAADGARHVVVLGSGFIGLEVAAALRDRDVAVTVVAPSEVPLAGKVGEELGRLVQGVHREHGTAFATGRAAAWRDGVLHLQDGSRVPADGRADLLVLATGVRPRTDLAEAAGLRVDDGVIVDARGRTSAPGVWAAGDVAAWPDAVTGEPRRVEHWAQAQRQGAAVALDLLGLDAGEQSGEPAYFWSKHWGTNLRVSGAVPPPADGASGPAGDVDGSVADGDAVVRYRDADGRVTAVAGVGRDREVLALTEELLRHPA